MSSPRELNMVQLRERMLQLKQLRADTTAKIAALEQELKHGVSRTYSIVQDGRTLQFTAAQLIRYYAKWLRYYDMELARGERQLQAARDAERTPTLRDRAKAMPVLPLVLLGVVLLLGLAAVLEPALTGLVVKLPKLYSDTVDRTFTENAVWLFTPEQQKAGERITSLKLTGSVEGSGTARVLLENKVVVEYTLAPIATPVESTSAANASDNATATAEPTVDSGLTDITGTAVLAKSSEQFTLECMESCALDIPAQEAYALTVEVSGVTLKIDTASYTTEEVPTAPVVNVTPAPAANVTAENVTAPVENITPAAPAVPAQEVVWSSTDAVRATAGVFDGTAYEVLPDSRVPMFSDRIGIVEVTTTIMPDSTGTLVAKHDYELGKSFRVVVNAEGTIAVELSDSDTSIDLETEKIYTDGRAHTLSVVLNDRTAIVVVDGVEEAAADISSLNDISTAEPMAIGADIAYLEWMQQAVDTFTGEITAVRVQYNEKGGSQ